MKAIRQKRQHFSYDYLVATIRESMRSNLTGQKNFEATLNALMSAFAMFAFKYPSMLKFDEHFRQAAEPKLQNLERLFGINSVPSDTYMRELVDEQPVEVCHDPFKQVITLCQRGGALRQYFEYMGCYIIPVDGTGCFSSSTVHCKHCCTKEHKNGSTTYHHQMFAGAIVHPDQKVALPVIAPEPIMNSDGATKNDCERNAAKRWIARFRKDHPYLPTIIVADGLSSNAPFIKTLRDHNCNFILVAKDSDHEYLNNWVDAADEKDAPTVDWHWVQGKKPNERKMVKYQYMNDVPLNNSNSDCKVSVVRMWEMDSKTGETTKWMWVTNFNVTKNNIADIARAGRVRWKIENETFNTLKNQGYQFEHNFGHGKKNLCNVLAILMFLAFLIDQCMQRLNNLFQAAYAKEKSKAFLWEAIRGLLKRCILPSLDAMYKAVAEPPPPVDLRILEVTPS